MCSRLKNLWIGICATALMTALAVETASAHFLWVIQENGGYTVVRGMLPDDLEGYDPAAVQFINLFDLAGAPLTVARTDEKDRVQFRPAETGSLSLAAVGCYWGHRVNTTRGKQLMTRRQAEQKGLRVLKAFDSTQTSKTLFADGTAVGRPVGMKFELIPAENPFALQAGQPLTVQLIFDGTALKHTVVFTNDRREATTDDRGIARIDVSKPGWQVIWSRHVVPASDGADVDYHQFMTFLVFEVQR
jgi:nickel transport protein